MKNILTISLLAIISSVLLSTGVTQVQAATTVNKFQITNTSFQENVPLIFKDLVVYRRHSSPDVNIYGYNLKTKQEFPLVLRTGQDSPVALSGKYLIYNEENISDPTDTDVRALNLQTKEDFLIAGGTGYQTAGALMGNNVAYIEGYNCGELFIYNIKKKSRFDTGQNACNPFHSSGKVLVWSDWNNHGVYSYNIKTRTYKVLVDSNGFYNTTPNIYHDTIVWVKYDNSNNYSIYEKDINSGKETMIKSLSTSILSWPAISDNFIAWVDNEGVGAHDIFVYNRKTKDIVQVSNDGAQQPSPSIPDIYGDTAVWMSWVTGNGDIYGATFK